jgi:hypothetical protein
MVTLTVTVLRVGALVGALEGVLVVLGVPVGGSVAPGGSVVHNWSNGYWMRPDKNVSSIAWAAAVII